MSDVTSNAAVVRKLAGTDADGDAWALVWDSVLHEDIRLATVVTKNPVASGSPISDHAYDEQPEVSITVVVSNVLPFALLNGKSWDQNEADNSPLPQSIDSEVRGSNVTTATGGGNYFTAPGQTRSQVALAKLDNLRKQHLLCNLTLGLMSFEDMFLTKIHCATDGENLAETLVADLDFVGLKITRVQTTTYPVQPEHKKATAPTKKVKAETKEPSQADHDAAIKQQLKAWGFSDADADSMKAWKFSDADVDSQLVRNAMGF